jgi:glutamine cyclotransferase
VQELSVLAQSRRAAQAKIAEADAEKAIADKFNEAAESMTDRALELYRLNVLERIGREEGSQIVVYGLNGGYSTMEQTLASTAAATQLQKK